jgi:hypothetical protein
MRTFMLKAPTWLLVFVLGVPFGVLTGGSLAVAGQDAVPAVIAGATMGLLFGIVVAWASRRQRRELVGALGGLPENRWGAAQRAAWRGPVPQDAQVRAAALDVAETSLRRVLKYRTAFVVIFGLNLVLSIINVVMEVSVVKVVLVPLWVFALVNQLWYTPRRLRARIAELAGQR